MATLVAVWKLLPAAPVWDPVPVVAPLAAAVADEAPEPPAAHAGVTGDETDSFDGVAGRTAGERGRVGVSA